MSAVFQVMARTVGIDAPSTEGSQLSEEHIYSLGGMEMNHKLPKGIYIKKNGAKTEKHIVK